MSEKVLGVLPLVERSHLCFAARTGERSFPSTLPLTRFGIYAISPEIICWLKKVIFRDRTMDGVGNLMLLLRSPLLYRVRIEDGGGSQKKGGVLWCSLTSMCIGKGMIGSFQQ